MAVSIRLSDLELLDAVRDFALGHAHPDVVRFHDSLRLWGDDWRAIEASYLPAADFLDAAIDDAEPPARELLTLFARHRYALHWEQSYRREDRLVPQAMLDGYGFAEIIGNRGPFVSERIRAGIGIWGPNIDYPLHHHRAEEIYLPLAGSAEFKLGDSPAQTRGHGDVIYVEAELPHGFRSGARGLVVYYLWQAGDLRQTSTFT